MRTKRTLGAALLVIIAMAIAAVAIAQPVTPTLTATKTLVTYPHSSALVRSDATTDGVILRQLAGSSDWTTFALVPSGVATTPVTSPKSTAAYELVQGGLMSDPVTISVKAQIVAPQITGRARKNHGVKVKGWIKPNIDTSATVQLTFFHRVPTTVVVTKTVGKGKVVTKKIKSFKWVQVGDVVDVPLKLAKSKLIWSYKWTPSALGRWKIVVSHEDVAHVFNSASKQATIKH